MVVDVIYFFKIESLNVCTGRVKVLVRTLFRGLDDTAVSKTSGQWRSMGCARLCKFGLELPSGQDVELSLLAG